MGCDDESEAGGGAVAAPPSPVFEGFEKRLEIEFCCSAKEKEKRLMLRSLPLSALEEILSAAQCSIVSGLSNPELDSYVLSESSLFVYPLKMIIKTCGTTQLLNAIPPLLNRAAGLSLKVRSCRYSRGAFMFPEAQLYPHTTFAQEVHYLDNYFGTLGSGSKLYQLMDGKWHVYSAVAEEEDEEESYFKSYYTLEVCMTELDRSVASNFMKKHEKGFESAREMSVSSGIVSIIPEFEVCEYAFDPCGYSMNAIAIEGGAYSTIHITPEENCSYASFEIMETRNLDRLHALIYKIASTFRPQTLSFSLCKCKQREEDEEAGLDGLHLYGYDCAKPIRKTLPGGGVVHFYSFTKFSTIVCS